LYLFREKELIETTHFIYLFYITLIQYSLNIIYKPAPFYTSFLLVFTEYKKISLMPLLIFNPTVFIVFEFCCHFHIYLSPFNGAKTKNHFHKDSKQHRYISFFIYFSYLFFFSFCLLLNGFFPRMMHIDTLTLLFKIINNK